MKSSLLLLSPNLAACITVLCIGTLSCDPVGTPNGPPICDCFFFFETDATHDFLLCAVESDSAEAVISFHPADCMCVQNPYTNVHVSTREDYSDFTAELLGHADGTSLAKGESVKVRLVFRPSSRSISDNRRSFELTADCDYFGRCAQPFGVEVQVGSTDSPCPTSANLPSTR